MIIAGIIGVVVAVVLGLAGLKINQWKWWVSCVVLNLLCNIVITLIF